MKKSVSVVVPLYNKENTIIETLDSLTTYFEKKSITYEIIIVENQSTDNSKLIVENYINKLNKIYLFIFQKDFDTLLKKESDVQILILYGRFLQICFLVHPILNTIITTIYTKNCSEF